MSRKVLADTGLLLHRSLREGMRSLAFAFFFPAIFAILMIALTSQTFRSIVLLAQWPIHPYAAYEAPAVLLLTAMMGAGYSATALVIDLQTGFLDRLRLLPVSPWSILLGRLLFDAVRVVPAFVATLLTSLALGARLDHGFFGALALLALVLTWSVAYNGAFFIVALRTRNPKAPFALVPLFMPLLFMSTAFVIRPLLPGWIRTISDVNPFTFMTEALRPFMTGGAILGPVGKALLVSGAIIVVTQVVVARSFSALVRAD